MQRDEYKHKETDRTLLLLLLLSFQLLKLENSLRWSSLSSTTAVHIWYYFIFTSHAILFLVQRSLVLSNALSLKSRHLRAIVFAHCSMFKTIVLQLLGLTQILNYPMWITYFNCVYSRGDWAWNFLSGFQFLNLLTEKRLESLHEQSTKGRTLNGILNKTKDKKALETICKC